MSINKIYAWGSTAAVVLAILTGLLISGTPGKQRLMRFDEQRVSDLKRVTYNVEQYRKDFKALPESLEVMVGGRSGYNSMESLPRDPETKIVYIYSIASENSYRLCADFKLASKAGDQSNFWDHDAGYYCYEIILPALPVEQG